MRHGMQEAVDEDVVKALQAVLSTPLGGLVDDATLSDVSNSDRLNEMRFHVPVAGGYRPFDERTTLDLGGFADVMRGHGSASAIAGAYAAHLDEWRVRQDLSRPTRGFMTGAIDLIVRLPVNGHDRYVLLDHKSNWLGERDADGEHSTIDHYHPAALAHEMVGHHYVLQYHIYSVAMHRFLRWRLGDRYDFDRHFGGALYLFMRGMIGPDTPKDDDGQPHGVFADRPPRALIEDLDRFLALPSTWSARS